ncbi:hypothetical protein [Phenylobacterium sp.]|uniref:hypothetical protein n=1 Tax=Phenylobacterium sp. TaxID=1871053 RepID=UPI0035AF3BBA
MRLVHKSAGRVRLEAPGLRGDLAEARRLAEAVGALAGVSKVEARAATGSLVIFHTGEWAEFSKNLSEALGAPIEAAAVVERDALASVGDFVEALDQGARQALGGRTNLSELTFLALVLAGAVQLARGEVVGPATTLFSQALNLMAARRGRPSA